MASSTTADTTTPIKARCPVCGSTVKEVELGRAGLTKAELEILKKYSKSAMLGKLLQLVDIVMGKIEPDKMNKELAMKNAVTEILRALDGQGQEMKNVKTELLQVLHQVSEKLAGPAIGKIGETITMRDFKAIAPNDDFSDNKADKHGRDIVATVNETKLLIGKIAISVKYDTNWKSGFVTQLERNMEDEGTSFGIRVTKTLPKDALSSKAYVRETRANGMILLVKPEYAPVAYYGYRQALIAWHRAERTIREAQKRMNEQNKVFQAVADWINGKQFNAVISGIDAVRKISEETDELAIGLKDYTLRKIKRMLEMQAELRKSLVNVEEAVQELNQLLKGDDKRNGKESHSST